MSQQVDVQAEQTEQTIRESLNQALYEELERDDSVILYGEDVAEYGGLYKISEGLYEEFGDDRVFDTPLAETTLGGSAVGAALAGARPIVEIMYADFLPIAGDHLINYAAKMYFNYGDETSVPMVVRSMYGTGDGHGLHHGQSPEAWFMNVPGLKIVMPSTPKDYKGLLKSAIRDDDPVLFLENKMRYGESGPVPEEEYTIPLCETDIKRRGDDATVVAIGGMVYEALEAAERLSDRGVECEVVDPRTVTPLDTDPILESVEKTNILVTAQEAPTFGGFGSEVAAQVIDDAFFYLDAPVKRVGAPFTPIPFAESLEEAYVPTAEDIETAVIDAIET
ncbi:alpha-ketoacid dehydrogenase subunit beta [Natronolimnohabitans innermongolicus]|uniref:Transketolase n=1 Tax=Natronolimnohabitans innermongolicus JCM 12255 TaxID=1227499 RepID=L9WP80_9EURY|nr:alpha-ketoacid dehydrogenase subunit beta [Natronolimnohabitans innermongolicus]ELY50148.1 transketolase [Natronolimnohabitans innermongolicus JCM 12255]